MSVLIWEKKEVERHIFVCVCLIEQGIWGKVLQRSPKTSEENKFLLHPWCSMEIDNNPWSPASESVWSNRTINKDKKPWTDHCFQVKSHNSQERQRLYFHVITCWVISILLLRLSDLSYFMYRSLGYNCSDTACCPLTCSKLPIKRA